MKIKLAGIDLSLTSPAICIFSGDDFNLSGCQFFYLTSKKKFELSNHLLTGTLFEEYYNDQQRYYNITMWAISLVKRFGVQHTFIEDYSFGSTGRVFNIAENCGLLKHYLWMSGSDFTTIPPTVIKKHATTKGNATKETLQSQFISDTGVDIKQMIGLSEKQWNPSSDIIDAYFICKCGYHERQKQSQTTET